MKAEYIVLRHTGESDGGTQREERDPKAGDKLLAASRREKAKLTKIRDTITILTTLLVAAMFVVGGLWIATRTTDPGAEPAMRVEMWCTGYASGFTNVMTRAGFQPPYSNEWERLIQECIDNVLYLDPYNVQKGISPPNPNEVLWSDKAPPPEEFCLPTMLRQCP